MWDDIALIGAAAVVGIITGTVVQPRHRHRWSDWRVTMTFYRGQHGRRGWTWDEMDQAQERRCRGCGLRVTRFRTVRSRRRRRR